VRIHAVNAIVLISPETAEARLLKMLKDDDALVRASAIECLGSLRNPSPQLLNSYIAALDDTDSIFGTDVRHAAAVALGNLQEKAVTSIPRLRRLAQEEENDWVKDAAMKAVQQITQGQTESDRTKR
jgi:HEAT repeat protein